MPPLDPKLARVRVSTTVNGTYSVMSMARSYDHTEGSEGESSLYWFGGEAVRSGDPTVTGTIPVYFDRADTTGQTLLRTAKRNGTVVFIQLCPAGTGAGAKCDQFEAVITEFSMSADAEGDAVEGSFSYRGNASTLTEITLV
jgi:hypothetical protein